MSDQNHAISPIANLISVIMPAYNAERFITEAIESVLAQSYPHWELIVVDDGSTDGTLSVIQRFTDPRITVIRQANKGEGGARNTGLDIAQGEYIGFLDADDLYLPNALADLAGYLDVHPGIDIVYSDGYYCDSQKQRLMRLSEHRTGTFSGDILEQVVLTPTVILAVISTLVRRSTIETHHHRFDESLRYGVDWDFWTEVARFSQFGYLPTLTCLYRVHGDNMTSATTVRTLNDKLVVGRLKIMSAPWFGELSPNTRSRFFYYLLLELLDGQPDRQRPILQSGQFASLPADKRAHILRLIASNSIVQRRDLDFAKNCLHHALVIFPGDRKSAFLLQLLEVNASACRTVLAGWRVVHRVGTVIRSIGQNTPRPVPQAMQPKT